MAYDKQATFFLGTEATFTTGNIDSLAVWIGEQKANTDIMIDARVTTSFPSNGTSIALELRTSNTISGTALSGTVTTFTTTAAIPFGTLLAGYKFKLGTVPQGALKYIALRAVIVGTFTNTGRIFAAIAEDVTSDSFNPTSPPTGSRY